MGELQHIVNDQGVMERFGASTKISDVLTEKFTDRGQKVATLLHATLTESPYTPIVDGQRFGVEVSNVYRGFGDETEGTTSDTVREAASALAEFMSADIPGADKLKLETHKTGYGKILKDLAPGRKDPSNLRSAFEEGFVETSRRRGVELKDSNQGLTIIQRAPERLFGLRLSSYDVGSSSRSGTHDLVTVDGRVVTIISFRDYGAGKARYYMSPNVGDRGGRAPMPRQVHDIGDRIIRLRTSSSGRR